MSKRYVLLSSNVNDGASCTPDPRLIKYLNTPPDTVSKVADAPEPFDTVST